MTWLRAAHNQLAPALGAVAGMSQLRVLDVSFNALRSFDGLGSLCLVLCRFAALPPLCCFNTRTLAHTNNSTN